MSETFTSIKLEVLIRGVWIDLWPDVLHTPAPRATRGIQSNGIEDRVGDAGMLTFSLRNDEYNSAGLIGRYSPGHTNCLTGWTTSLPVRLGFTYDTWTRYKWAGRITPDGIKVFPGTNSLRRVDVTCEDFMGLAARHRMNLMTAQYNKHPHEALQLVLNNMPLQPQAIYYDVFDETTTPLTQIFPVVFDISGSETTALGEFQKIATGAIVTEGADPGLGYIVARGDGLNGETLFLTIRFPNSNLFPTPTASASKVIRQDDSDFILLESGDVLLREGAARGIFVEPEGDELPNFVDADILEDSDFGYGENITNYVTVISSPRKVDSAASTVLWTLEQAISIDAEEKTTIRGTYNDPVGGAKVNGIEFVTPVASTDYKANAKEDGTGTDMTSSLSVSASFGSAEVELILQNIHATDKLYVGGGTAGGTAGAFFQVRGKGVYTFDTVKQVTADPTSIRRHGVLPLNIDTKYVDFSAVFSNFSAPYGQQIIDRWKDPLVSINRLSLLANKNPKNMTAFMFLEPCDGVAITESMNGLSGETFRVMGYEFTITDGTTVFWSLVLQKAVS